MINYSTRFNLHNLKVLCFIAIFSIVVAISGCTPSVQSTATQVNSEELEQQVLQIIRNNPEAIIESVQAYQQQQQEQQQASNQEALKQFKTNPQAKIGNSPTFGSTEQKIVLFEFSDFQCPFCSRVQGNLKEFMDKHQDRVTLVFKHLPLIRIHPQAIPAARAAWAAQQQGKFWEYHDALFEQQDKLGEEFYIEIANNLNLDIEKFNRDRQSQEAINSIQEDIQLAQEIGASGTPFFVMNGETFSGAVKLSDMEKFLAKVSN
ncbi:MAG: thioredoxin domain-containing protein [Okeania sp. SIO3B5]|uniref:DsbA family protein n=1 Tax=Okeania sp. SIO3B5 TaxID=2607811 RepID=UPI0013FE7A50|nr:thioredoxin domain-containing protein [Okeania sp. SIO3B5]NEO53236.1 thioredoxin domain-containing protein [Okeania sp. SIO3B5]